jgi:HAE1 family hydrophobic/amphiphilic exporter-1
VVNFFIRRPVFATVCSLLIVLAGAVSIPSLPIAQFPNLSPPQVSVSSYYTGANSQAVETSVTTLLEQAINGAEGMRYMSSMSRTVLRLCSGACPVRCSRPVSS